MGGGRALCAWCWPLSTRHGCCILAHVAAPSSLPTQLLQAQVSSPSVLPMQAWSQQQHASAVGGSKPPGLELKVSFGAVPDTQAAYGIVMQALGGLLCAGVATAPQLAVMAAPAVGWFTHQLPAVAAPDGRQEQVQQQQQSQQQGQQRQVYAWLPQEVVCSENLAAWRRLLPCRHQAGLAALLQPVQLAAASYVSLGLQLQVVPQQHDAAAASSGGSSEDQQQPQVQLRLVLTAMLPQPATQPAPAEQHQQQGLVEALFGCSLPAACPAATSSMLYVVPGSAAPLGNSTSSCSHHPTSAGHLLACNILQRRHEGMDMPSSLVSASGSSSYGSSVAPAMQVVQHTVQRGSRAGTLVVGVRIPAAALQLGSGSEPSGSSGGLLHVMQLVPWQLPVAAASLRLELNGQVRLDADCEAVHVKCVCLRSHPPQRYWWYWRGQATVRLPDSTPPPPGAPRIKRRAGVAVGGCSARPYRSHRAAAAPTGLQSGGSRQ